MKFTFSKLSNQFNQILCIFFASVVAFGNLFGIQISQRGCYDSLTSLISYSFYEPTEKIRTNSLLEKTPNHTIYLAKNEREGCQFAVKMRVKRTAMMIELTDFKNANGDTLETEIYSVHYVPTTKEKGLQPDPLVPIESGYKFIAYNEATVPFYINVRTNKDTPTGDYTANVKVYNSEEPDNERETVDVEIKCHVWDFTLPETPSSQTAFGLWRGHVANAHKLELYSDEEQKLYETYYEFLVDHKISPYDLPVDILSDEADKYMSDPRVVSFVIPYYSDDATLVKAYNKVQSNPEWAKKGYFYPVDEPSNDEAFASLNTVKDRLSRLCPGYNMVTPFNASKFTIGGEEKDALELINPASNLMCGLSSLWSEKGFKEKIDKYAATGDYTPWWYVCCGPTGDYCNFFIQQEGLRHRILFWQQKDYDVDGILYWSTTYWSNVNYNPWQSSLTFVTGGYEDVFGDGSLLYNGNWVDIDGPVGSLRLEGITNGLEDFDYLTMAEELFGEEYVEKVIDKVTTDLESFTYSDEAFAKVRIELGNAIEKELSK